ncbi:MAG: gephyrin-like molybdotransferase Glp [Cyclobacteriaceae bacterium]
MISIQEAQSIISTQEFITNVEVKTIRDALGYCLSSEIRAPLYLPPFDNSAMDGYAVCGYQETYDVIGEIAAGDAVKEGLMEGQAMRIFTGGKVPENTTAVIMQEKTLVNNLQLIVGDEVVKGKNIRNKGSELKKGDVVFSSGQTVTPAVIATLSSLGLKEVEVYSKPKISIIATGNELVDPGAQLMDSQIYESNSPTLRAALFQTGFSCNNSLQIKDDFDAIKQGIGEQLNQNDVLLISGGISVGDYDFVKKALEENGVDELFYKVAQKPGKPLFFGRRGDVFVFALPGNPASALTCFYIHVLPLLHKLAGKADSMGLTSFQVPLAHEYVMKSERPIFFKARLENDTVTLLQGQSSAMLHTMGLGNAIVLISETGTYQKGNFVKTYILPA